MVSDMTFVQRSTDQQQRQLCFSKDGPFGRDTVKKLNSIRHQRLDMSRDVLTPKCGVARRLALATGDSQRTLRAFYEFRSSANVMVNSMYVIEEYLSKM